MGIIMRQPSDPPDEAGGTEAADHEPDYRFTLANERTFLAWIRTALALLAGAIVVVQLVPNFAFAEARRLLAGLLAVISVATVAGSAWRWQSTQRSMRRHEALPRAVMPWLLAAGITAVGLLVLALVVIFGVAPG